MTLLSVRGLGVRIAGALTLEDVSLDVAPGEILALTGESGSGKSMTALAVMGLLPEGAAATGRIDLDGTDILTAPERALCDLRGRTMGMVFQEPMTALDPLLTIGAQVALSVRRHDPAADARAVARTMLARVGLGDVPPDRYPHQLSGGQRQRVVIAGAIAMRPRLLIADEPTTALDVTTQARILDLLRDLVVSDRMGMLMITHDLAVVAGMADRIAVMQAGRIVEAGPAAQVLTAPGHAYTRALLSASRHVVRLPPGPAEAAPEPLLVVEGVSRDHPGPRRGWRRTVRRAVDDVSFVLHPGERLGLVGESGCGKSTLARAILGLDPVQAGRITLAGADVATGRAVRRRLQAVFQDPYGSFDPRHRVGRLIAEPLHLLPRPPRGAARADLVARALTGVGLAPSDAGRHIHAFSGGQRQRIAIARALVVDPDIIVFDEAVSALDVSVRARVLDLLADLARQRGLGWIFISHDLSVVRGITDRVLVMQKGRIVEDGPTVRVLTAPRHPYTAELIAAAPVLPVDETRAGSAADTGIDPDRPESADAG